MSVLEIILYLNMKKFDFQPADRMVLSLKKNN
jgi:hypothetical protein